MYTVKFTDGTNYITFSSANQNFDGNTVFNASIGDTTSSGIVAMCYNMNGDYNSSKGTSGAITRVNQTFRIDKNRNEISLWVNDQIEGRKAIAGLSNFGESWFELRISDTVQDSKSISIKQIGLNLEC